MTAMTPVLATAAVFGFALAGLLVLSLWLSFTVRLPATSQHFLQTPAARAESIADDPRLASATSSLPILATGRTRAGMLVDSIAAMQQREEHLLHAAATGTTNQAVADRQAANLPSLAVPLGRSYRRTARRVSGSSRARDARQ